MYTSRSCSEYNNKTKSKIEQNSRSNLRKQFSVVHLNRLPALDARRQSNQRSGTFVRAQHPKKKKRDARPIQRSPDPYSTGLPARSELNHRATDLSTPDQCQTFTRPIDLLRSDPLLSDLASLVTRLCFPQSESDVASTIARAFAQYREREPIGAGNRGGRLAPCSFGLCNTRP